MIELNGIKLKNRIVISSVGYGDKDWYSWPMWIIDPKKVGAVITKTLTLEERRGYFDVDPKCPPDRWNQLKWVWEMLKKRKEVIRKMPGGYLNAFGLWNVGIEYYFRKIYPETNEVNKIISVAGFSVKEYIKIINRIKQEENLNIAAIELNAGSCPSVETDLKEKYSLLKELCERAKREAGEIPLILKISPEGNWLKRALIAQEAGLNAVHAINTIPVRDIDLITGESPLRSEIVGQSGTCIRYKALYIVFELAKHLEIPVIGGGGVCSERDVRKFFCVGASAVNVTSLCFSHPLRTALIIKKHCKNDSKNTK